MVTESIGCSEVGKRSPNAAKFTSNATWVENVEKRISDVMRPASSFSQLSPDPLHEVGGNRDK